MIERVGYRPLRDAPKLAPLITAVGFSFILQNVGLLWLGGSQKSVPNLIGSQTALVELGGVTITNGDALAVLATAPLVVGVGRLRRPDAAGEGDARHGPGPRRGAADGDQRGYDDLATFLIGGLLAGAAGLIYALYQTTIWFFQGFTAGLIAFTAAVMGGIGNLRGAVLGGLVIGCIQQIADNRIGSEWTPAIVFAYLILILVVRPRGLARRGDEGGRMSVLAKLPGRTRARARGGRRGGRVMPAVPLRDRSPFIYDAVLALTFVAMALGLNIIVGFAGLLDLGYVAFFAIGAYTMGWLGSNFFFAANGGDGVHIFVTGAAAELPGIHLNFILVILVAVVFTTIAGMAIGLPTLRLRGDYIAVVTLAFGEIIGRFAANGDQIRIGGLWDATAAQIPGVFDLGSEAALTGGKQGITPIDKVDLPFLDPFTSLDLRSWYFVALALVLIVLFVNFRLRDSRLGRAWVALREDEVAASSMGIPVVRTKLWAYGVGAAFGGMSGAFLGSYLNTVNADQFQFSFSIFVLAMVILGGLGSIWGVVVGAVLLSFVNS